MKFVDRVEELKALGERLDSDIFEFIVIYGRRRVGSNLS
ncbi:ATP-binding protein [Methermicoccus shengliensis]|nr:ATP-binding protein [Methermicoccus shengliensis]